MVGSAASLLLLLVSPAAAAFSRASRSLSGAKRHGSTRQPPAYILVRGATGVNAAAIVGDYVDSGNAYNGRPLFAKEGDEGRWLRFVTVGGLNQWRISSTSSLEAHDDQGYAYCADVDLRSPAGCLHWYVWSGSQWELQPTIEVSGSGVVAPTAESETGLVLAARLVGISAMTQFARVLVVLLFLIVMPTAFVSWLLHIRRGGDTATWLRPISDFVASKTSMPQLQPLK
mmetsp:Transcript_52299/g.150671  ORF Transcript_52299/g.150671 Transcript_52299/m.150671 type:complete len:229 (-) Transcript_52299:97-783(-)